MIVNWYLKNKALILDYMHIFKRNKINFLVKKSSKVKFLNLHKLIISY